MNPTNHPARPPTASRWWLWLAVPSGVLALILLLIALAVWNSIRIGSDARALRASASAASGVEWRRDVEFSVGALPLCLARGVLGFVHQAPPEARTALRAIRAVEVGVYHASSAAAPTEGSEVLSATDSTMSERGWDRIVGVRQDREVVGVYVPRKLRSTDDLHACVLVIDGSQLVVVSAQANLETLLELARSRPEWQSRMHASVGH